MLFTTGDPRDAVVRSGVFDSGVGLIGKPSTIEELASRVRQILDHYLSSGRDLFAGAHGKSSPTPLWFKSLANSAVDEGPYFATARERSMRWWRLLNEACLSRRD